MNTERLTILADALRNRIPAERFDMRKWRSGPTESYGIEDHELRYSCGFAGCAVGWACALPEFKEQGLAFSFSPEYTSPEDGVSSHSWAAVEKFFYIDYQQALWLFMPAAYFENNPPDADGDEAYLSTVTPGQVADRIVRLVNNDVKHEEIQLWTRQCL